VCDAFRFDSISLKLQGDPHDRIHEPNYGDGPKSERKVFDDNIVKSWREEVMGLKVYDMDLDGDVYKMDKMFDNVS
jgi:hypothetical protein